MQKNNTTNTKTWWRELMGYGTVIAFVGFVSFQIYEVIKAVRAQSELAESYVLYSDLKPEKAEYHPGELVTFTYTRSDHAGDSYPLLLTTIDSFENKDTGEIFQGAIGARVIERSGIEHRKATRRLADFATPGTYVFQGSAKSETSRMSRASFYISTPFTVTAKEAKPTPTP